MVCQNGSGSTRRVGVAGRTLPTVPQRHAAARAQYYQNQQRAHAMRRPPPYPQFNWEEEAEEVEDIPVITVHS